MNCEFKNSILNCIVAQTTNLYNNTIGCTVAAVAVAVAAIRKLNIELHMSGGGIEVAMNVFGIAAPWGKHGES